jgi:nifR3 family TIM-barrel protein
MKKQKKILVSCIIHNLIVPLQKFIQTMKISGIDLGDNPLLLAPMEDVTDIGFRKLCKRYGAAMVYTEFVAAEALVRNVKSTVRKLTISDDERPVGIQIYGRSVADVVEAARIVEAEAHPDVIDMNFGCPVKKVAGKGAGAGMLQTPDLLINITREVVKAVNTPVTVKTRLGWSNETLYLADGTPFIVDLARRLADCGIAALTLHGRTRAQMYTGNADWTLIGEVKKTLMEWGIPVIGNGDITSREEAKAAFEHYGVDGVMIGRATFGQPWLFSPDADKMTPDEKMDVLMELLHINREYIGDDYRAILHTRRHLAATPILKGIPDFRPTRIKMLRANTVAELEEVINDIRKILR